MHRYRSYNYIKNKVGYGIKATHLLNYIPYECYMDYIKLGIIYQSNDMVFLADSNLGLSTNELLLEQSSS